MRLILAAAVLLFITDAPLTAQEEAPPLPSSAVPMHGRAVRDFVPRGWRIAASAEGDLDGDGRADRVLHLVPRADAYRQEEITAAPQTHALLIVLADASGYRRAGLAPRLLQTLVPQYLVELRIRNGVLVVHQNYGMTEVEDVTHRFRLDRPGGRFVLIGLDRLFYTRPQEASEPRKVSENYLTGVRLVTIGHWGSGDRYHETETREPIARTRRVFDDIDEISQP